MYGDCNPTERIYNIIYALKCDDGQGINIFYLSTLTDSFFQCSCQTTPLALQILFGPWSVRFVLRAFALWPGTRWRSFYCWPQRRHTVWRALHSCSRLTPLRTATTGARTSTSAASRLRRYPRTGVDAVSGSGPAVPPDFFSRKTLATCSSGPLKYWTYWNIGISSRTW